MTDYETEDGERYSGAEVFGYLKSGTWTIVSYDNEQGIRVVETDDGETIRLRKIPGSEQHAYGPHIYTPGKG